MVRKLNTALTTIRHCLRSPSHDIASQKEVQKSKKTSFLFPCLYVKKLSVFISKCQKVSAKSGAFIIFSLKEDISALKESFVRLKDCQKKREKNYVSFFSATQFLLRAAGTYNRISTLTAPERKRAQSCQAGQKLRKLPALERLKLIRSDDDVLATFRIYQLRFTNNAHLPTFFLSLFFDGSGFSTKK